MILRAQEWRSSHIAKLLYIGEAANVRDRVNNHDQWPRWKKQLTTGQVVCVSAAPVTSESSRQRAEAALIFKHKPPVNVEYAHSFPFDTTTINASGETAKLTTAFTVCGFRGFSYTRSD